MIAPLEYQCPTCATTAKWRSAGDDLARYYCPQCDKCFETLRGEVVTPPADVALLAAAYTVKAQMVDGLMAQLASREAEVARLRESLQPFSFAAAHTMPNLPATVAIWNASANGQTVAQITLGDLRKAREALMYGQAMP